jgi:hypothetical protein
MAPGKGRFTVTAGPPNIVLVIIDSLRFDRLGISGYRPALTPNLDGLARRGIHCINHFSCGCPSQVAVPGIFTSSLPFDYGGYNEGIRHRPYSFVEVLQHSGYQTFGVTACHWFSSHYGADRGFDRFVPLFDLSPWFKQTYIAQLAEPLIRWESGQTSDASICEFLCSEYDSILLRTLKFLDDQERAGIGQRGRSRSRWRQDVNAERELLSNDPLVVAEKLAIFGFDLQIALGKRAGDGRLMARLTRQKARRALLNRRIFLVSERRAFEAGVVNGQVRSHIIRNLRQPFFAFIHYFDLHEAKLLIPNLTMRRMTRLPIDIFRAMNSRPKGLGGRFYDIGLSMIDRSIGELLRIFARRGLSDNTVFLITADHGKETGIPHRGVGNDLSKFFTDDFLHVPFIVAGPNIKPETVDSLMSHLDLAPTILELAGLESPPESLGFPLSRRRREPADYVMSENAGKGRCDLDEKTLYLSVRTNAIKVVFEATGFSPRERDVFDLRLDPNELKNLRETNAFREEREFCSMIVRRRLDTLRRSVVATSA